MLPAPSKRSWLLLAAILIFAAAIRIYLFRGFIGLDDGEYARIAYQTAQGSFVLNDYSGPPVFPLRVGLIAPTALLFAGFGVHEWTIALYPLMLSLCGIALVYFCGALFFNAQAGLVAAALLAIFPFDVENATKLLPDLPAAFFASAGVALVAFVDQRTEHRPRLFWGGVLAGIAFGLSWLAKESVTFLVPFCIALMVVGLRRRSLPTLLALWAGVAAGSGVILLVETLVYYAGTGDLLFRLHEIERNYAENQKYFFTENSDFGWEAGQSYRQVILNRLLISGPSTMLLNASFLYLPLVSAVASLYAIVRRDRSFLVPALWFWTLVLMFNFSSTSTRGYMPLTLSTRYLYPLFYASVVLAAGFLVKAIPDRIGSWRGVDRPLLRAAAALAVAAVVWTGARQLALVIRYPSTWLADMRRVKPFVTADTAVYADTLSLRVFDFFTSYPVHTGWVDFQDLPAQQEMVPGSLVLINRPYIAWLDRHGGIWGSSRTGYPSHPFYESTPKSWTPIWTGSTASLFRIEEKVAATAR